MKTGAVTLIIYAVIVLGGLTGWIMNICKLTQCDFAPSYKAEVIRIIGIPVAPVGCVVGYFDLGE